MIFKQKRIHWHQEHGPHQLDICQFRTFERSRRHYFEVGVVGRVPSLYTDPRKAVRPWKFHSSENRSIEGNTGMEVTHRFSMLVSSGSFLV